MVDIPDLDVPGKELWHWGDPDYYKHKGIDYIIVPIYSRKYGNNDQYKDEVIACFKTNPLSFISYTPWPYSPGWCAVDNKGNIYTSKNHPTVIDEYEIEWDILTKPGNQNAITSPAKPHNLKFSSNRYTKLMHMQGGEFTISNELLYLVSGSAGGCLPIFGDGCGSFSRKAGPGEPNTSDGIHVFRTSDWQEIETSVNVSNYWINSPVYNSVYFNYTFENDLTGESPEGLTIWKSKNTNPLGDLFVLLFDWDFQLIGANNHQASLFSFTNKVHLDDNASSNNTEEAHTGKANVPFQNLKDAVTYYPIWDGAELILKAGNYNGANNQNILINKRVLITSQGGSAVIGRD